MKPVTIPIFIFLLLACSANKKASGVQDMPECLREKIKAMASDPGSGSPQSITRYRYKQKTVYYMVSPCCDKFNIVYDSACNILGHPDGGFTGKGDGKMTNFREEAVDEKVVWKINEQQ